MRYRDNFCIATICCTFALIKQLFPTHFFLFNDVAFFIFRLNALQLLHLRVLLRSDVLPTVPYIHTYIHNYHTYKNVLYMYSIYTYHFIVFYNFKKFYVRTSNICIHAYERIHTLAVSYAYTFYNTLSASALAISSELVTVKAARMCARP